MKQLQCRKILFGAGMFVSLFLVQVFLGKAGHFFARMISYRQIDPFDIFAELSVHHAVQMVIALILIVMLSKLIKIDFYFALGDKRKGLRYVAVFSAAFLVIAIALHILMSIYHQLPVYSYSLDRRNIIGILGFQLFLSGPSEEIVFRALPIPLLIYAFGGSISVKGNITLEVILASVLFSCAHINWSICPLTVDADLFQIIYAFLLGSIQGVVYQKSRSILYPMLMHSCSNVFMVGIGYLFAA